MITVDISKDYLELFTAKKDIETMLIEAKEIDEEFSLPDFIKYLNFGTHIYVMDNQHIFPFKLLETNNETYLFIANVNKEDYKPLYQALEKINYDFSILTKKETLEMVADNLLYKPYFIINNKMHFDLRNS